MSAIRSKLVTGVAIGAAALSATAIATAASGSGSSSASSTAATPPATAPYGQTPAGGAPQGRHTVNGETEKALTGDTAAKVKQAALAKVSGTVQRVETNVDGDAPYEAHIRKSDGTEVEVQVSSDFTVAAVNTMGQR